MEYIWLNQELIICFSHNSGQFLYSLKEFRREGYIISMSDLLQSNKRYRKKNLKLALLFGGFFVRGKVGPFKWKHWRLCVEGGSKNSSISVQVTFNGIESVSTNLFFFVQS